MKSRLDKYRESNKLKENNSRLLKNKHLYDDLNNKIGFEELVDFNTQTRIELTSLNSARKNRESYHQLKDYQGLMSKDYEEQTLPALEEEEKVFDINSILEEAKKNRTITDELEKKRKLKDEEYNILKDLNKKYLSKEHEQPKKDEYEGLEELINTITSKTLVSDIKKEQIKEEVDLLSDLVATSVDLQVNSPLEYEDQTVSTLVTKLEVEEYSTDNTDKKEIDNSFYTKSMDLSELDFMEVDDEKSNLKKGILITLIIIILLAIIGVISFIMLKHLGII